MKNKKLIDNLDLFINFMIFIVLFIVVGFTYTHFNTKPIERNLAGNSNNAETLNLGKDWEYLLTKEDLSIEQFSQEKNVKWLPYDIVSHHDLSSVIVGQYWLKKEFILEDMYKYPTLIIGYFTGKHKVFLNGKYIGGGEYFRELTTYTFDKSILKKNDTNVIYVKGETKMFSNPGVFPCSINLLPMLGEYEKISKLSFKDLLIAHFSKFLYLIAIIFILFSCYTYYLFNKDKLFLYFSFYLGISAITMLYYNFFVANAFELRFYYFLRILTVTLASFIMFSIYLYLNNKEKIRLINKCVGLSAFAIMSSLLLISSLPIEALSNSYVLYFRLTFYYSITWLLYSTILLSKNIFLSIKSHNILGIINKRYDFVAIFTGILITLNLYYNAGYQPINMLNNANLIREIGLLSPFIFSILVFMTIVAEHILKTKNFNILNLRSNFTFELAKLLNDSDDFESNITLMQESICRFIDCERSTIYLQAADKIEIYYKAKYIFGQKDHVKFIKNEINPKEGLIGIVNSTKLPLFVKNLNKDPRTEHLFKDKDKNNGKSYKTNSCMIFPLIFKDQLVGFITFADKRNGMDFTDIDYNVINNNISSMAILIHSAKVKAKMQEQFEGIIKTLTFLIDQKDPYTDFHSTGVSYITQKLCEKSEVPYTQEIKIAAMLHDLGKIFVPRNILNKPDKLNKLEFDIIKEHPKVSKEILEKVSGFERIAEWAGQHHETLDGKGYPYGLTAQLIPIEAQIIGIADFIDALSTNRAYRPRFSFEKVEEALLEMASQNKFSPKLVELAIKVIRDKDFKNTYSEKSGEFKVTKTKVVALFDMHCESLNKILLKWNELNLLLESQENELDKKEVTKNLVLHYLVRDQLIKIIKILENKDKETKKAA